uniref:Putative group i salivary lipocalin n=1 Tax=Rhipicephalus pulchellus TaxID=72859 RepID=L7LRA5_RHIPC
MALITLAFVFSIAVGSFGTSAQHPTLEQLEEALNTRENFWHKRRTAPAGFTDCKFWRRTSLTGGNYSYEEWYRNRKAAWTKVQYVAQLERASGGAIMKIRHRSQSVDKATRYQLKFWLPSEHCAIFEDLSNGNSVQHVWDSNVEDTRNCDEVFFKTYGYASYLLYRRSWCK